MANSFVIMDVKPGEQVSIGNHLVTIELLRKTGQLARLRVGAPPQVPIKKDQERTNLIENLVEKTLQNNKLSVPRMTD